MINFQADYFDGVSSRAVKVEIEANSEEITFSAQNVRHVFRLADIHVQPKLGHARRAIELSNGGRLEAGDITVLEALKRPDGRAFFWRWLHRLENHLGWALFALMLTLLAGWGAISFVIPALAEQFANATPPSMEHKLGEQVLAMMDEQVWTMGDHEDQASLQLGYFKPSQLDQARQTALSEQLKALCATLPDCPAHELEFRGGGKVGANAFALPGGFIIVTDELVALAKTDMEIITVLMHELGHVKMRHTLRQTLQGALSGLLLAAVTGDVDSLASGLPAALMQLSYSRQMESEADAYALTSLQRTCVPPHLFADILQRLEHESSTSLPEIISSHPDNQARVQPFLEAKLDCEPKPGLAQSAP
ncbi:M48 family metallopeptidase [Methylobacter sp. YRD-M1]|uniref:M48 family metallopeptidase n=1 Tax=Methylobacter sp. YRD-M1 TaxID=2911520 RepID=UPI00227C2884|nr:M48 family metallopeptidase [Methylobacter sp. YRD-M1]WAK01383.1 M48 family metallopeptidase [Methylobacter sp. YRD-M1]